MNGTHDIFGRYVASFNSAVRKYIPFIDEPYGIADTFRSGMQNYPAVPSEGDGYLDMFPDEKVGNSSFWHMEDPYIILGGEDTNRPWNVLQVKANWIVLCPDPSKEDREHALSQLMDFLFRTNATTGGSFKLERYYRQPRQILSFWNYDDTQLQPFMAPKYGFRFNGTLTVNERCT